jgi:hypothetical protein
MNSRVLHSNPEVAGAVSSPDAPTSRERVATERKHSGATFALQMTCDVSSAACAY